MSQSLREGQRDTGLKIGTPIGTGNRDTKEKPLFLAHFVMLARDSEWDKGRDELSQGAGPVAGGKRDDQHREAGNSLDMPNKGRRTMGRDMREVFKLNETMMAALESERRRAQMVARAEVRMIISLFDSILAARAGGDLADWTEAALRTAKLIELRLRGKASPQLIMAVSRFLISGWQRSEPIVQREYVGLLEQLMEHHLASAQIEK